MDRRQSRRQVLVVGATGLIGAQIVARLASKGVPVAAVVRTMDSAARRLPASDFHTLDLRRVRSADDWMPYLGGVGAVINCAGVLQDGARDSTDAVHHFAPLALFEACRRAGIRRFIHFSAMGADKAALSDFSETKGMAEHALEETSLDWVILRPSVVVGRAAYGGSALFRGLAALPILPSLGDAGRISVVQLDDVVETVIRMLKADAPSRVAYDLAGPEALTFEDIIGRYRAWLGWKPARRIRLPEWIMALGYRLGDVAGRLGWRPPVRTSARLEMRRGAAGDPTPWMMATGVRPMALDRALDREPASVQDRWFARLFLLKPLLISLFALFWIITGIISLGPGFRPGAALMIEGGAGALSGPVVVAGGIADLLIGMAVLWRPTARRALLAALALSFAYLVAGSLLLPRLWEEPLGPMLKVWPIIALNLVLLAILDER